MGNKGVTISRETIRKDAERFSQLHSWYKIAEPFGAVYYLQFLPGEQSRNGIDPEVGDTTGLHLWFVRADPLNTDELAKLPGASFAHPIILTRDFCGNPRAPEDPAEMARQKMIACIVQHACAMASAMGIVLEE